MATIYTHDENKRLELISGWYEIEKENQLHIADKTYLYLVGTGIVESSCCGEAGFRYAVVPGCILSYRSGKNASGYDMTEIDPVRDPTVRKTICDILLKSEDISQVNFW